MICMASILQPNLASAQPSTTHPFLGSSIVATQQILKSPNEIVSPSTSLQKLVDQVSQAHKLGIWVDRRVVRDRQIRLQSNGLTVGQVLENAANQVEAKVVPMDGCVAIVPLAKFDAYASAYWELSTILSAKPGQAKSIRFGWEEGTESQEILRNFFGKIGITRLDIQVPWDIWRTFEFANASAASVSVCILGGFDLVLVESNGTWTTEPMMRRYQDSSNRSKPFAWNYSSSEIDRIPVSYRESWRKRWPEAEIAKTAKPVGSTVLASAASHLDLVKPLIPEAKPKPKPKVIELSGTIQGTASGVLQSLAKSYQLSFDPMSLPPKSGEREFSLQVDKVSLDDLIRKIGKAIDVDLVLQGSEIRVQPIR
jgi:hypothetical protein